MEDRVANLESKVSRLESIAWVLGALAVIFGLGGSFGYKMFSSAKENLVSLQEDVQALERSRDQVLTSHRSELTSTADKLAEDLESRARATAERFLQRNAQFGRTVIGQSLGQPWKRATVTFPEPFTTAPIVLVSPDGDDHRDAFTTTLIVATETKFIVEVRRVDGGDNRWRQQLALNWLAVGSGQ